MRCAPRCHGDTSDSDSTSDRSTSSDSSSDSTSSDSSSDSDYEGCSARPYAARNQDGKFDTCSRFAKKFKKFSDKPLAAEAKVDNFTALTMSNIVFVGGENVQLTRFDVKAIRKKQICVEVLVAHADDENAFVRMKLRNKADVETLKQLRVYIILNKRAFETWRQFKKFEKKKKDVFGQDVIAAPAGVDGGAGGGAGDGAAADGDDAAAD